MKFSIDRGGTFTDIYAEHEGKFYIEKLLSVDPGNYDDAPREGIRRLLEKISAGPVSSSVPEEKVEWIRMGTTVATNALLEKKGARTALLITKGFADLLRIGYQNRPELFDLHIKKPAMLYEKVVEIEERVLPRRDGTGFDVITPLDVEGARKAMESLREEGIEALAVVLLHAYQFLDHENMLGRIAREIGFEQVSLSHEVIPSVKAVIRGDTTVVDAYLTPHIRKYIEDFSKGFVNKLKDTELLFMQSNGGLSPADGFRGSNAILSGPAGGVLGLSSLYEGKALIGFDMGGTSTDVSRYDGGMELRFESEIAGTTVRAPQLDIMTVAAGGGSRLFFRNGMFAVGPESSGAEPGPVCYRKGGYLSITDANLVLGRLVPSHFPRIFGRNENEALDRESSREAFEQLGKEINKGLERPLSVEEIAYGFLKVANDAMSKPVIEVSVARGFDIKSHTLASFGGAGGQHACAIARDLGMEEVIVHRFAGILSAYGIGQADIIYHDQVSIEAKLDHALLQRIEEQFAILEEQREGALFKRVLLMRYEGTEHQIMVEEEKHTTYAERFSEIYRQKFGFILDHPLIVDEIQLQSRIVTEKPGRPLLTKSSRKKDAQQTIRLYGEKGWQDAGLYKLDSLEWGDEVPGPAIISDNTSTIVVEDGAKARLNQYGDVILSVSEKKTDAADATRGPNAIDLSIFANLFISIAKQMGAVLQNAAVSTNIKERLDFSCALFDAEGNLISNAPHVPVHLGSMSHVVKYMLQRYGSDIREGDVFLSNAPFEGGSHLPDITVITPLVQNGSIVAITASRGHHADIGGVVPGSMPSFSHRLEEEGAVFTLQKLVEAHRFREERVRKILHDAGARKIEENIADIQAQTAANRKGVGLLEDALSRYGREKVLSYMQYIQEVSFRAISSKLKKIAEERGSVMHAEDLLDNGARIVLGIHIQNGKAVFDFTGSSPELEGNQNTPVSVVSSAVVYVLRSIIDEDLPLNEGLMRAVQIILPERSLLNPSANAAVVGGNVTTSQRIVDVIFRALGNVAASQGCMNNVTFGNEDFGYYETIAGGSGAGVDAGGIGFEGADAVHTHMTNTLITDPEVIERRYPVMIEEFSIRKDSGGKGEFCGGNGVVRSYRFFEPVTLNLLTERRVYAPWGVNGAGSGAKGINEHFSDGKWHTVEGKAEIRVEAGERIRIKTPGGGGYNI